MIRVIQITEVVRDSDGVTYGDDDVVSFAQDMDVAIANDMDIRVLVNDNEWYIRPKSVEIEEFG